MPALLARDHPALPVYAQEERAPLLAAARAIWQANGITQTATRQILSTPLFTATDAQHAASGLRGLLEQTACTVLFVNDPRVSAEMIAQALQTPALPRLLIAGPRALADACDADRLTALMKDIGYHLPDDQPLNEACVLLLGHTAPPVEHASPVARPGSKPASS